LSSPIGISLCRHDNALGDSIETTTTNADPLTARAIAYYQAASYGFKHRLLNWNPAKAR
jgi:hypothetical protein